MVYISFFKGTESKSCVRFFRQKIREVEGQQKLYVQTYYVLRSVKDFYFQN